MNKKGNSNWKLFLGLAAGAAAGWWLNSNKGRQWRKSTSDWAQEKGEVLNEQVTQKMEQVKEDLKKNVDQTKEYVQQIGEKTQKVVNEKMEQLKGVNEN